MERYVEEILRDGVTVMPLLSVQDTQLFREAFIRSRQDFPEYRRDHDDNVPYVMGGFGAYGNPSSFHNAYIRTLRLYTSATMIRFFSSLAQTLDHTNPIDRTGPGTRQQWFFEQLFDRMCCRPAGSSTSAESEHRDLNPQTVLKTGELVTLKKKIKGQMVDVQTERYIPVPWDYCFGGWINLDAVGEDQVFSCVLKTHTDSITMTKGNTESGFSTQEALRGPIHQVVIPSGHIIIFFQRIQHIVTPSKRKKDSFRQFRCWRLFKSGETQPEPLNGLIETEHVMTRFGVPRLPSRQLPPMYGSNHGSAFLFKNTKSDPIPWSLSQFIPICLEDRVCASGQNKGRPYRIVKRFLGSLYDYNLQDHYPIYTDDERQLLVPNTSWSVPFDVKLESVQDILNFKILDRRRTTYTTVRL